ncbi:sensor histidine kinase N-terminal domain-containing protein [Cereibacter sphaeroides]|uniref:sensor histidine kinase n=1 Tax=Cereibacter sphaeroides TaxID=1063 RepID=UPI001F16693D|nr:histidine kinase dimerization/phospho-acceptor domain-containing protein [Cereibacter sphaeroides]MCE6960756.1 sensor histidine kinase N-terminal domain-containing protein [Cereibacter sphaeroides]MCE6969978.1 sensor histidine kinase N-terminal domain-containing protein [Cereibacter sphaeroides]MCE6974366.1 sensor histidine kinase N-terminal domain-containing protein [Cereibacter sphaeroides]
MRRARSLRRDLALSLSAGIVLLWTAATLLAIHYMREELDELFDSALQETAERLLPLAVAGDRLASAVEPEPVARAGDHEEGLTFVIRDASGTTVLWSQGASAVTFADPLPPGFRTGPDHRIYSAQDASGQWTIEIAEPLENRREAVEETLIAFVVPLLLILPITLALVAWRTRVGLARLRDLSREVQGRDETDLRPLGTRSLQVELLPIRDAVDRLMARLGRALDAERSFTANAAHELRTPVAAALAQTQRLVAEAPESLRPRAEGLEAELKRLARLSEKLLQLSRAEGAGVLAPEARDLAPLLHMVVEDFRHAPEGWRIHLEAGPLVSHLDPDAFAILARNLIENALAHGDGPVEVTLGSDGLAVTNDCRPIPSGMLSRLATRFERGRTHGKGSGLGLAIASGIVNGAGWQLRLASPVPGRDRGFQARAVPPQDITA